MSNFAGDDPFTVAARDIDEQLADVKNMCSQIKSEKTQKGTTFLANELRLQLTLLAQDVDTLDKAVKNMEKDREKFKLTVADVSERRLFVQNTRKTIEDARSTLHTAETNAAKNEFHDNTEKTTATTTTTKSDGNKVTSITPAAAAVSARKELLPSKPKEEEEEVDLEMQGELERQTMLYAEQDEQLDQLSKSVNRLHAISTDMKTELTVQARIISELDGFVDTTSLKLASLNEQIHGILQSESRGSICVLISLVITLLVLTLLVFLID